MPVVLIAASAGGIEALHEVLGALPRTFGAAVVIVQHRGPDRQSLLARVLARASALPVIDARDGDRLAAGTIYVAKADQHLTIDAAGAFQYVDGRRIRHVLSSANPLFASAAAALGPRAIAVVLTGSGMDATDGVQAIKTHGGVVIAQDRATSAHFGMPGAAIETGVVDYVIPLAAVAPTLVRLVTERAASTASHAS